MAHRITGDGLLSLVADFQGRPRADVVAAAGYYRPDGRLSFTDFYVALLAAKGLDVEAPSLDSPSIPRSCGDGPAIYVACLASYNNGILYGSWLDLSDGPNLDDIREAIEDILSKSPARDAEEWAIHDNQCLPGFLSGEFTNLSDIAEYAEQWADLSSADAIAYRLACEDAGEVLSEDDFRSRFRGFYDSERDFAMEWAEERGYYDFGASYNPVFSNIDWDGVFCALQSEGANLGAYIPGYGHPVFW
jgi:antirestriction protein